ncbi:hypothetical protein BD770DRAFT_461062 [Pilaira anomala]|nr:hypothetical protein BD770DRAFT_461062 [Pilaira anomala]
MDHSNQQQKDLTKKINIGILLSIEKKLLESSISTKDDMKKIVYKSGLVGIMRNNLAKNAIVFLSVRDIINISLKPFLRDMVSVVSTSLVSKELFGLYNNIEYPFNVMNFTENRQLQPILASLLEEETGISNEIQNVEPYTLVVPKLFDQLLQPAIIYQQSMYNKSFRFEDIQQGCQKILNVLRYGNRNIHNTITQ